MYTNKAQVSGDDMPALKSYQEDKHLCNHYVIRYQEGADNFTSGSRTACRQEADYLAELISTRTVRYPVKIGNT